MKQCRLFFLLVVFIALVVVWATPPVVLGASKGVLELKTLYGGSQVSRFAREQWVPFFEAIEKATNGKIKFIHNFEFVLLPPPKMYDGLVKRVVDIAYIPTSFNPNRFVRSEICELPGLAWDRANGGRIIYSLIKSHLYKDYSEVYVSFVQYGGPRMLWTTKKPVRSINDLRGMRIRYLGQGMKDALIEIGAVPVGVSLKEMYMSAERGLIDGCAAMPETLEPYGLHELHHFRTNLNLGGNISLIAWNKESWKNLGSDLQPIVTKAIEKYGREFFWELAEHNRQDYLKKWPSQLGVELIELPPGEIARWEKVTASIYDKWAAKLNSQNYEGSEILNQIRVLQKVGENPK